MLGFLNRRPHFSVKDTPHDLHTTRQRKSASHENDCRLFLAYVAPSNQAATVKGETCRLAKLCRERKRDCWLLKGDGGIALESKECRLLNLLP